MPGMLTRCTVAQSKEQGNSQGAVHAYQASKALAERAAWDFVETHKPVWDLATICPPYVYGPPIQQVGECARTLHSVYPLTGAPASADKLNTSVSIIWGLLHGNKTEADLLSPAGSVVDVRDVARAHVLALATPAAGGHRFATSIGAVTWQDMVDAVHASDAVPAEWKKNVPVGTRGGGKEVVQDTLRGDKAAAQLGLKYHTLAQTYVRLLAGPPFVDAHSACLASRTLRRLSWTPTGAGSRDTRVTRL
jgi:nucleoside-diphosphate-sugar epimerase